MLRLRLLPLLISAALATTSVQLASAEGGSPSDAQLLRLIERAVGVNAPGCALAVTQNQSVTFEGAAGFADLTFRVPNTPRTIFYIASDSKEFTAFAIGLLVQEGKLTLADPITKWIPELPAAVYGSDTIADLVYHTSGIRDYWGLNEIAGKRAEEPFSQADFLRLMSRQKELNFPAGDHFEYSNANYALLGTIVGRASGQSLPQFAADAIFKPLGMTHTAFAADHLAIVPNRAYGYNLINGQYEMDGSTIEPLGDGGVRTTVEDLTRWTNNLAHNRLGVHPADLQTLVETSGRDRHGKNVGYAFGLGPVTYDKVPILTHSGKNAGYASYVALAPSHRLAVVVLCNNDGPRFAPWTIGKSVLDLYLLPAQAAVAVRPAPTAPPATPAVQVAAADLARDTGTFQEPDGTIWMLSVEDGALTAKVEGLAFTFQPVTTAHFRAVGAPQAVDIFFSDAPDGTRAVELQVGSQQREVMKPFSLNLSAADAQKYVGRYYNDELDTWLTVTATGTTLQMHRDGEDPQPLVVAGVRKFDFGQFTVQFTPESTSAISDFRIAAEGVGGMRFAKTAPSSL
jgi:CubicO group peptidase (beta-lactamase class C family)